MPELLLELFSEEIPARMQTQAARDLARMAEERFKAAGLPFDSLKTYAGPRRLTLVADGLPAAQADREEELKGPRANAPEQALDGFLRKTGLSRADLVERDGIFYAVISQKGRPTPEIIAEIVEAILRAFPWPKSMRWGSGTFRWVRPLKRILCVFDKVVVPFSVEGIASGDVTEGHRFMGTGRGPFSVRDMREYRERLAAHFVVLEQADRKRLILDGAHAACAAKGVELVEDEGLLEEVSGLAEWPVPVLGDMDPGFLDLPPEVIRTSMRTHQKYFAVRPAKASGGGTGEISGVKPSALAPHFLVTANIAAPDGGATLAAGNAKVLSARLNDARFFWNEDRKLPLEERLEKLKGVTFHAKLGTMFERVARIEVLAREIAPLVGADPELAAKAARLAKADLGTGMVGEFPELQGIMGGYYARAEGRQALATDLEIEPDGSEDPLSSIEFLAATPEPHASHETVATPWYENLTETQIDAVADAVRDHYKPAGPSDTVPAAPVTVAVALADKLDTLVGFFAIDEKPTGSKDPYALRRAMLGFIRVTSGGLRLELTPLVRSAYSRVQQQNPVSGTALGERRSGAEGAQSVPPTGPGVQLLHVDAVTNDLLAFFADRLKVVLRDEGKRHDLVDAVFALGDDDLVRIMARVDALSGFLATDDGASLLAGYKRATNILKAEAKKGGEEDLSSNPELSDAAPPEEAALVAALRVVEGEVDQTLEAEDFTRAMRKLSHLRAPVDAFFDKVLVNDPDAAVRLNRLRLLTQVRDTANRVADFSLISG
jgi:glycyl-tRNA synthetase beta chain